MRNSARHRRERPGPGPLLDALADVSDEMAAVVEIGADPEDERIYQELLRKATPEARFSFEMVRPF